MTKIADEYRALDSLAPHSLNYNAHGAQQVASLADAVRLVAFTAPIICRPDGVILGGHARRLALLKLREEGYPEPQGILPGWQVPCRVVECNAVDEKRILVTDNPDPAQIEYDSQALASLLSDLQSAEALSGTWYDEARLDELIGEIAREPEPGADEWGAALGNLPEGDKAPFQQMTFTLSDAQAEQVREAMDAAKDQGPFEDTGNENSNGNALARICETFLNGDG